MLEKRWAILKEFDGAQVLFTRGYDPEDNKYRLTCTTSGEYFENFEDIGEIQYSLGRETEYSYEELEIFAVEESYKSLRDMLEAYS